MTANTPYRDQKKTNQLNRAFFNLSSDFGKNVSFMYLKLSMKGMNPSAVDVYALKIPNSPINPNNNIAAFNAIILIIGPVLLERKSVSLVGLVPS